MSQTTDVLTVASASTAGGRGAIDSGFREAQRELTGLTARAEKRALAWLAPRRRSTMDRARPRMATASIDSTASMPARPIR